MQQISFNALLDWPRTIGIDAALLWGLLDSVRRLIGVSGRVVRHAPRGAAMPPEPARTDSAVDRARF
jgi:hypothetical protein